MGTRKGRFLDVEYRLRHCPGCHFTYVENPSTDYAAIYDESYYRGQGADPSVDYVNELDHPEDLVRVYEWRGILDVVGSLVTLMPGTRWFDYGCGHGGLVRHVRENSACEASGLEEGWIAERARENGIPIVNRADLDSLQGSFDIVTAIEVIEHVVDPVGFLKSIRALLKPGGLLFLTTGNARPYRDNILSWSYVVPEIHVSFFEPETLARALTRSGFRPEFVPPPRGYVDILRFKILKNLGLRHRSVFEKVMPWAVLSRIADARYGVSAQPIAWAT